VGAELLILPYQLSNPRTRTPLLGEVHLCCGTEATTFAADLAG
jgi:hypothetical protein